MRRFAAISAPLFLMLSCTQATLAPEEVFTRSMGAIREFTSANFIVHARSTDDGEPVWTADANGKMASGGRQLSFDTELRMHGGDLQNASFKGKVVIPSEGEVYLNAEEISLGQGMDAMLSAITGTWWKLPETGSGTSTTSVTPDPSLLAMQLETVTLTKDHGTERINQRLAYKYDVTMEQEKLLAYLEKTEKDRGGEFDREEWTNYLNMRSIRGTVWIDAELFLPNKIMWTIESSDPDEPETIEFDVTFTEHNENISVLPPETSTPFPLGTGDLQNLFAPSNGSGTTDLPFPSLP